MIDPSRWQIRCLTCGLKRRALDAGIVRVGGWGRKYTIGWCSRCRWLRCAVVEATAERGFEVVVPTPPGEDDGGGAVGGRGR